MSSEDEKKRDDMKDSQEKKNLWKRNVSIVLSLSVLIVMLYGLGFVKLSRLASLG